MSPYIPTRIVASPAVSNLPTSPIAGMQGWYDCSDVSTLTIVSNNVSQWNDKSGNGFNFTQGTGANRPLYSGTPRTIKGITVPEFAGSQYMDSSLPADSRTSTTFVAGLSDNVGAGLTVIGATASGGNELNTISQWRTTKGGVAHLMTLHLVDASHVFAYAQRLTSSTIDGAYGGSVVSRSDSTAFTGGTVTRLGGDQSLGVNWDGLIAEMIRYSSTLSDSDVQTNLIYLMSKWGP